MARFSKFRKRMQERLIDGVDIKLSKRVTSAFEGSTVLRLVVMYKGDTMINYPQCKDAKNESYVSYNYGSTMHHIMSFIDSYFLYKHETAFNMTAEQIIMDAQGSYFFEAIVDDLLLILKVCDRRTGKRRLWRLFNSGGLPENIKNIIKDRLKGD